MANSLSLQRILGECSMEAGPALESRVGMDKRADKRHKRAVKRAKQKVTYSEPDLRTPEQIHSAREASRPDNTRGQTSHPLQSRRSSRDNRPSTAGGGAKTDA